MDLIEHLPTDRRQLPGWPGHVEVVVTADHRLAAHVLRTCGQAHHATDASRLVVARYVSSLQERVTLGVAAVALLHHDQVASMCRAVADLHDGAAVALGRAAGPLWHGSRRLAYCQQVAVLDEGADRDVGRLLGVGMRRLAALRGEPGLLVRRRRCGTSRPTSGLARAGFRQVLTVAGLVDRDERTGDRCGRRGQLCGCPAEFLVASADG